MHNPSTVIQESSSICDFESQYGRFIFRSMFQNLVLDGSSSFLSNFLYFDGFGGLATRKISKVSASLNWKSTNSSGIGKIFSEFNRAIRFHCERIPIGFASLRIDPGNSDGSGGNNTAGENNNGLRVNSCSVMNDDDLALNVNERESPKKVLILMSDTGGGHRASAEAIKAAFHEEFGNEYQVSVNVLMF